MNRTSTQTGFNPKVYAVVACGVTIILLLGSIVPLPSLPRAIPAQRATTLRTIPNTDVNPYGANFFLDWEVEPWKVEKTLQMAREAGLGWASVHFAWEGLEPKKGHFWDDRLNKSTWDKYDFIVQTAQKYGLKVIARLDRPPAWTRGDNTRPEAPPDDFNDYGDFVEAVASHYKGLVGYYQIWNEPNIFPEWGNQPVDPAGYVMLLKLAYQHIKKADANATVLSAPLAQTTEQGVSNLNELDFLEAMYRAGAKDSFDILFANGYGFDSPPEAPPDPQNLNFARVLLLRHVMERNGDAGKAVWFHEFGWNASPETMSQDKLLWRRVTEQQQADYTVRAIRLAREEWPWAGVFDIWYFRQDGHIPPDRSEYYFRMVDPGFTPRPIYSALVAETRPLTVAGPGAFQETNPALIADSNWHEEQDQLASGGSRLVGEKPGSSITVKFAGTEFALVVTKEQRAAGLLITVDGRVANLLPTGGEGRSYLDLASATPQPSVVVPVADGLPYGEHVVRIVIAPERGAGAGQRAAIDGFQVGVSGRNANTTYAVGVGVIFVLVIAAIWRRRRPARNQSS